jgi:hypothetical protein
MAWTRLTDRETDYARYILDNWDGEQKPAILDRNVITFVGEDGRQEFLEVVQDEASYDSSCGAKTVGARLAAKIRDLL